MKLKHAFHQSFASGAKQLRFKEWLISWRIKGFKIFVAIFSREIFLTYICLYYWQSDKPWVYHCEYYF